MLAYFLKKIGFLHADDSSLLSKIVMNLTLPAIILITIPNVSLTADLIFLPFISLIMACMGLSLGFFLFKDSPPHLKGLMMMGTMGLNLGLFAFPILEGLFGSEGIKIAAIMDIGNAITILGVSYLTGAHYSPLKNKSKRNYKSLFLDFFKSTPLVAYFIGIIMNILGLHFPEALLDWMLIISRANQFLILVVLGLVLNLDWRVHGKNGVIHLILLRLLVSTVLSVLFWNFLPYDLMIRKIIVLCLYLPTGFTIVPFSMELGYDRDAAGAIVNISLIVGFFIMWGLMIFL